MIRGIFYNSGGGRERHESAMLFFRHSARRRLHLFSAPEHFAFILASFGPTREGVGGGGLLIEFSLPLSCLHSLNQPNKNNPALTNYAPRGSQPDWLRTRDDAKVYAKKITTLHNGLPRRHQGYELCKEELCK
jgi:hypothetical protein